MKNHKDFTPANVFARFKQVPKVRISGVEYLTKVDGDFVYFTRNSNKNPTHSHSIHFIYERWLLIDGILHYIQKVNNWMGGASSVNYVKAEIE